MTLTAQENFTVVIISRELCSLTHTCISKIREYYPDVAINLVVDQKREHSFEDINQIISNSPNLSYKRNLGVEEANTKYIAFIDSDAYPYTNWLEEAYKFLEDHPEAGLVGGANLRYEMADDQDIPYLAYTSILLNGEPAHDSIEKNYNTVASSNMLFERSKFIQLGGMSTTLFTGEDIDLGVRFSKKYTNYFVGSVQVGHKQRTLKGFIKQRYVWGRGIFNVLKHTFPAYITSLVPFIFIAGLFLLSFFSWKLVFTVIGLYILVCTLESIRTAGVAKFHLVLPYISLSIPLMGIGACVAIFKGDINNDFKLYDNRIN